MRSRNVIEERIRDASYVARIRVLGVTVDGGYAEVMIAKARGIRFHP